MCVKDMPSVVARGCPCVDEPATVLMDLVLNDVAAADDRIEAAYAIVELGERASGKKGEEHPSLADEEDLDAVVEETEQYHQVPRSPECLRPLPPPKAVHVRGAVMPTRPVGTPVQKLTVKRRHNDDDDDCDEAAIGGGIKAKLARMLIQRKFSNEGGAEKSNQNDGIDICRAENVYGNDSVEEPNGRFVRTSAPVVGRPVSVILHTQSVPAACPENPPEYLEVKTEQSISVEEINRLRSSLREHLVNEQVTSLDDSHYRNLSQEPSSKLKVFGSKSYAALKDYEMCSSEDSSKDVTASSSLYCPPEHVLTSGKDVTIVKPEAESPLARHCFLPRSAHYSNSMAGISELLQYYMLPVMKSSPNSVNTEFGGVQPAVLRSNIDALKRLEQLSLGRGFCSKPVPKGNPVVPEARNSLWNVDGYSQLYGALNDFRGHRNGMSYSSASEATYPLSSSVESLSLKNLSAIQRDSPQLSKNHKKHQYVNSDSMAYESKKPTTIKDGLASCTVQKFESKVASLRRKPLAVLQAQEMINGGQFGSLATIRNLYNRMKSRNVDSSAYNHQNIQHGKLPTQTGHRSLVGFEEQEQVLPLDLSSCHRRMSHRPAKLKVKTELCPTYPPSVQKPAELCTKEDLKATVESCAKSFDVLPPVKPEAAVRPGQDSASTRLPAEDGDKHFNGSSTHSVPNSHLPPKKRKFRQTSQNCDFSESKTSPSVKSALTHEVTSHEPKSSQTPVKSHSDKTLETVQGRKSSESDTKVLPDLTADEENMLSAVTVRDEDGDLLLHIAVAQGSVDIVQKLLPVMSKVGVSVDSCNNNRQTALHLAVISNQVQMVDLLLKASASANVCDRKGNTVVHLAIKYKALPCLKKILQSSRIPLNLDARNYEGLTALHIGVQLSQPDAVQALLIGGANPNTIDGTNGRTPLFNAVEANDFTIASTLVQHGSDPFMASYSGCTPLQIAAGKSLREMIGVLEKSGKEWSRRIQECI